MTTTGINEHPTPHTDVNEMVQAILVGARDVLGANFLGMYLYGSLASGDFDHESSDIDFLVATREELSQARIEALTALHAHIASGPSKWAVEIEGSYIPLRALRRHDPANAEHPHIYRGRGEGESCLFMMRHGSDWVVQRHILREQGVVIAGPPPSELIDPISPDDLQRAVRLVAREWFNALFQDPELLRPEGYHGFMIISLCRILYTLEHGAIVSKPAAARWARETLDPRFASLIAQAITWKMPWERISETLAFTRYAMERIEGEHT